MLHFAKSTPAVEAGFLAAGITVSVAVAPQSLVILVSWI